MGNFQLLQLIDSLREANDEFEDFILSLSPKVIDNLDIFQFLPFSPLKYSGQNGLGLFNAFFHQRCIQ
jgi:hypothetical protein